MSKLLNALITSRFFSALLLIGGAISLIGCQSTQSNVNSSGAAYAPVRESEPISPDKSRTLHNPLQNRIEASLWPLATNSARVYPDHYDLSLMDAITQRWYSLLNNFPKVTAQGKVVLEFTLCRDGTVVESRIVQSTVGPPLETTCQHAVLDPAPFPPWPETMRREFMNGRRAMTLTFYLNGND
jgi:TonB family protein